MRALADTAAAGWPLAATLALALAGGRLREGRRRLALNRALHELRRPLQLLAIGPPGRAPTGTAAHMELAIAALAELEREINGEGGEPHARLVGCRELVGSAVGRWRGRVAAAGGSIALRWQTGDAVVLAEPARLSQALDNLIANAIEHGGSNILVRAWVEARRLRISVADDGSAGRPDSRRGAPSEIIARLSGRRRRGFGLAVVRQVAAAHHGRFALHRSERGALAVLELPLARAPDALAA